MKVEKENVVELLAKLTDLKKEIGKVIVGQDRVIEELLITFCAGGHALLQGVPGLAKTLMIRTLADAIDADFKRIQFTPDLMPTDIVGTDILEEDHKTGKRHFTFQKGPVFTHILLADEINRTPPKTQAALLEAMQEFRVTAGGKTLELDRPFFVLATQNPIEQSGTYPLPEAQLDRFLMFLHVEYPDEQEEFDVLKRTTGVEQQSVNNIMNVKEIMEIQQLVRQVTISDDMITAVNEIVRKTRPDTTSDDFVKQWVEWGAGPRAGQAMILTAKARALLNQRYSVTFDDVKFVAPAVLRHRLLLNFNAETEGITADQITQRLMDQTKLTESTL
ncbi:MAG: MoxR family ATPase [Balneolaceae bacterium]